MRFAGEADRRIRQISNDSGVEITYAIQEEHGMVKRRGIPIEIFIGSGGMGKPERELSEGSAIGLYELLECAEDLKI